ncbi:MAG: amidohydrolase family protein [Acidobacteria bacterium]|nr:amidohydrolase family protein [Acidobacteriota bacterium]MCA1641200.1 amidohydrolase family protein [Acidobacteriota bacterium]
MPAKIYSAQWVLPVSSPPIEGGAVAVEGERVVGVGARDEIAARFPEAAREEFGASAILPGLINCHSHIELTAMRGYLEDVESNFFAWLFKLTAARMNRMTAEDLRDSAAWGAVEAARAGVTTLADACSEGEASARALGDVGLRGIVYQEAIHPDPAKAAETFEKFEINLAKLRARETPLVRAGVSPHAPYSASAPLIERVRDLAERERLPLMIHAAESEAEDLMFREGRGTFAESLAARGIEWRAPRVSPIRYLERLGLLRVKPVLAHCVRADDADIETIRETGAGVAHCPKSNAKLGHGRAPYEKFLGLRHGFGSDSVASNNTCDILEEARFALLVARSANRQSNLDALTAERALHDATLGGAHALGFDDCGSLEEGKQADLTVVRLDAPHQTPAHDPARTLVFASSGRDVTLTAVAGREIFRDGRVVNADEERLRARMNEIKEKLGTMNAER